MEIGATDGVAAVSDVFQRPVVMKWQKMARRQVEASERSGVAGGEGRSVRVHAV